MNNYIAYSATPDQPDPWDFAARMFEPPPTDHLHPATWANAALGEHLWSMQREIANSIVDERYTAVQSCHDAGKSFSASRIAAWWIASHPPGEAFVVSTAPTAAQVSAILWREISKAHKKGNLTGSISMSGYPKWTIEGGELVGYGRKPADYSESAFQGIHARFVLVIMDEANGIDQSLFNAVDSLATNEQARVLAIGNPDDPSSHFATVCKPDSGWNVIRIDGLRTPNMTEEALRSLNCRQCRVQGRQEPLIRTLMREEGIAPTTEEIPESVRPMLLSPLWVEERLHRWVGQPSEGKTIGQVAAESALFTSKVRGLFPDSNSEGVIPLGWIERAVQRWNDWRENGSRFDSESRLIIGADIARSGTDETCFALRRGAIVTELRKHRLADTMETTGYLTAALTGTTSLAVVDVIGVGAGVVDRMRELEYEVLPFNASGSARDMKDRSREFGFVNLRAAAWWNLREMLDPSRGAMLALPDDEMMKSDLNAPRWRVTSGGKIQIESKDDVRKRLGRSTDAGDAVVQAAWYDSRFTEGAPESTGAVDWMEGLTPDVLSWGIEGLVEAEI